MGRPIPTSLAADVFCPTCHCKDMRCFDTGTAIFCSNCNRAYRVEQDGLVRVHGLPAAMMAFFRSVRDMSSLH